MRMRYIQPIFLAVIITLVVLAVKFFPDNDIEANDTKAGYTPTKKKEVIVPTEEELKQLEVAYDNLVSQFGGTEALEEEIKTLYDEVVEAVVCSEANRKFNSLEEKYKELNKEISDIETKIYLYESQCAEYEYKISTIPLYSSIHNEKQKEYDERMGDKKDVIEKEKERLSSLRTQNNELYVYSKQIADDFFNEYFDIMCKIVNAEAGICLSTERWYVANVVENRIASERYPNTIYEVVFQKGQYETTWNGAIDQIPSDSVKKDVELYLRGKVDTGMPSNVLYQALFKQGSGVWKAMVSGHYFCYQ